MNILEVLIKLRDDLKLWVTNNILALKEEIDNKSTFSGEYDDLSGKPNIDQIVDDAISPLESNIASLEDEIISLDNDFASHENNDSIHITQSEKDGWNAHGIDDVSHVTEVDKTTWNEHVENNDIHVTESDKIKWNNKSEFSGNYNDLEDAPDISDDGNGDLKFIDEAGYIIAQIDYNGIHTTNMEVLNNIKSTSANIDSIITNNIMLNGENIINTVDFKVNNKFAELVDSAPETLDTLNELAEALGNDPNFATTIMEQFGFKADKTEVNNRFSTVNTTISNLNDDIEYIETNYITKDELSDEINTSINDALIDVNHNISLLDSDVEKLKGDETVAGSVANAVSVVNNKIDEEITARQSSDNSMFDRLTTIENNYTTKTYVDTELSEKADKEHGTHLELGTTSSTAYRGDYGNIAYTHSQATHAPSNAQKNSDITKAEIEAKLTGTITSHDHDDIYAPVEHGTHLTLGTTSSTAYRGDYGNIAYNHSQSAHAPSNAQKNSDITKAEIEAKLTGTITSHDHDDIYAPIEHGTHLTIGTGASNAAAGNHTHNYAGSSSAGGAANSANKVNTNLVVKLNSGTTEGTNLFTFNGSAAKTINITPSSIGAAEASHGTHLTIGTGASNAAAGNHTHNYAGSSSAGGAANSVKTNLVVKLNGGSTEGTDLFTFNGSTAKTINITPSSIGAAASSHGTHLTLGTTSSTAYRGDYGNTAYNHSQSAHAPSNAQKNSDITKAEIEAKLTGTITSHTHNYAGSSSAGGAANSVKTNLIIKLNGGVTEGTDLFTFNGSTAKTINITPANIGAAASSHGTHVTWATSAPKANGTAAVGTVARVAREDHVHPLQTTINGYALWSGTKAQYDAITSKSSSTFYFILE